nr:OB-fold domain-containing protein [Nocardia amikacinitolerans]
MIRRCGGCDKLFAPLTAACATCQSSELEWVPSAGFGSIVSWRLVHRSASGPHTEVEPLTTAVVELDEGPWVFTTIEGDVPLPTDEPVRVRFQPRPGWIGSRCSSSVLTRTIRRAMTCRRTVRRTT